MNILIRKLTCFATAAALGLSLCLPAAALRKPVYYIVEMDEQVYAMQSVSNRRGDIDPLTSSYDKLRISENSSGSLVLIYNESGSSFISKALGKQDELTFQGDFKAITLDQKLSEGLTFNIQGKVNTLVVSGPVDVVIQRSGYVDSLRVTEADASITVETGGSVAATSAVRGADLNGIASYKTLSNTTRIPLAPQPTTSSTLTYEGKAKTYLYMEEASPTREKVSASGLRRTVNVQATNDITFISDTHVALEARAAVPLSTAIRDLVLEVRRESDDTLVAGYWKWENITDASSKEDDTYTYIFTPHNQTLYDPIELQVDYTNKNPSGVINAPVVSFGNNQATAGYLTDTTVELKIAIPAGVESGDYIQVYAGNQPMAVFDLYESDEIEYQDVTIDLEKYYAFQELKSGDIIRFRATIQRNNDSRRGRSAVLKYKIA